MLLQHCNPSETVMEDDAMHYQEYTFYLLVGMLIILVARSNTTPGETNTLSVTCQGPTDAQMRGLLILISTHVTCRAEPITLNIKGV